MPAAEPETNAHASLVMCLIVFQFVKFDISETLQMIVKIFLSAIFLSGVTHLGHCLNAPVLQGAEQAGMMMTLPPFIQLLFLDFAHDLGICRHRLGQENPCGRRWEFRVNSSGMPTMPRYMDVVLRDRINGAL